MQFLIPPWLKKATAARHGSRAHLVLWAMGALALLVLVAAWAMRPHHVTTAPVAAVAPAPAQAPVRVPSAAVAGQPAITAPRPVSSAAVPAASAASAAALPPVAAPAAIVPPIGLVAGQVRETIYVADQYGQFAQSGSRTVSSVATAWTSYTPAAGTPAWRQTFSGWFHLASPAHLAVLRRGAGVAAKEVSGTVDGTSLGASLGYGIGSETSSLTLVPGWHTFEITASGDSRYYQPPVTPVELLIGDGTNAATTVTPYAVTPTAAQAPATTGAPAPAVPGVNSIKGAQR